MAYNVKDSVVVSGRANSRRTTHGDLLSGVKRLKTDDPLETVFQSEFLKYLNRMILIRVREYLVLLEKNLSKETRFCGIEFEPNQLKFKATNVQFCGKAGLTTGSSGQDPV